MLEEMETNAVTFLEETKVRWGPVRSDNSLACSQWMVWHARPKHLQMSTKYKAERHRRNAYIRGNDKIVAAFLETLL